MKYKLLPKKNPQDREAIEKYYAIPLKEGMVGLDHLSRRIADRSSLMVEDVNQVLEYLLDEIPGLLLQGNSVNLERFGIFRISFSSDGVKSPDKFNPSMIRGVKILFRPGVDMMGQIREGITFDEME